MVSQRPDLLSVAAVQLLRGRRSDRKSNRKTVSSGRRQNQTRQEVQSHAVSSGRTLFTSVTGSGLPAVLSSFVKRAVGSYADETPPHTRGAETEEEEDDGQYEEEDDEQSHPDRVGL